MIYPTRCKIIDVVGIEVLPGIEGRTPPASQPHVGKEGMARKLDNGGVEITLDDGSTLYGGECWWIPIEPKK
jgi:hypothetical protein